LDDTERNKLTEGQILEGSTAAKV